MKTKACEWRWALVFTRFLSVVLPLFTKQWGFAFREAISIWSNQYAHQLRILWPKSENLIVPRVSLQGNLTEMWKCLVCDLTAETFNILLNCYCHRIQSSVEMCGQHELANKECLMCIFPKLPHSLIFIYATILAEDERVIGLEKRAEKILTIKLSPRNLCKWQLGLILRLSEIGQISRSRRICTPHFVSI